MYLSKLTNNPDDFSKPDICEIFLFCFFIIFDYLLKVEN